DAHAEDLALLIMQRRETDQPVAYVRIRSAGSCKTNLLIAQRLTGMQHLPQPRFQFVSQCGKRFAHGAALLLSKQLAHAEACRLPVRRRLSPLLKRLGILT